jgi:hypothetical protein
LERNLLAACRSLAREQRERIGEIGASETEDGEEVGGSVPPLSKKALSALATFAWLMLKPAVPSAPVRFRIASVAV